jgi:hypothetical protein
VLAAKALCDAGAIGVVVAATHAIFSDPAPEILQSEFITSVVVTDTLPVPPEKRFPALTVLPIAPLLARAIREVFGDGSVTSLFDGAAQLVRRRRVTRSVPVQYDPRAARLTEFLSPMVPDARTQASGSQKLRETGHASFAVLEAERGCCRCKTICDPS